MEVNKHNIIIMDVKNLENDIVPICIIRDKYSWQFFFDKKKNFKNISSRHGRNIITITMDTNTYYYYTTMRIILCIIISIIHPVLTVTNDNINSSGHDKDADRVGGGVRCRRYAHDVINHSALINIYDVLYPLPPRLLLSLMFQSL